MLSWWKCLPAMLRIALQAGQTLKRLRGGIGRRARFRTVSLRVEVQVLSEAHSNNFLNLLKISRNNNKDKNQKRS